MNRRLATLALRVLIFLGIVTVITLLVVRKTDAGTQTTALVAESPMAISATLARATPRITLTPSLTPTYSNQILVVNKLEDTDDGICDAKDCSLREAIATADWGATITFVPNLTGTIALDSKLAISRSLTIKGPGPKSNAIIISGKDRYPVFDVSAFRLQITLNLSFLTIVHGKAGNGAGITNDSGTVVITDCTFQDNSAGSAVYTQGGQVVITNSTFVNNAAVLGGAVTNSQGILHLINDTFENNSATVGAAVLSSQGDTTIINSTFHENSGSSSIASINQSSVILINTIVAGNPRGTNCSGAITDGGGNLQHNPHQPTDQSCGSAILQGDPKLGPLTDAGGATQTLALLPGSPALGLGLADSCPSTDQRGINRKQPHCDSGAFEYDANATTTTPIPLSTSQ